MKRIRIYQLALLIIFVSSVGSGWAFGIFTDTQGKPSLIFWGALVFVWGLVFAMVFLIAYYMRQIRRQNPSWLV